jgi:hypothetical protein
MRLSLTALSGIAWTIVYIDAIRIGFKHKTYAIPVVALALNIAWETIYAVLVLQAGIWLQGGINVCWALLDLVIVYTFARFGRAELPALVTRPLLIGEEPTLTSPQLWVPLRLALSSQVKRVLGHRNCSFSSL